MAFSDQLTDHAAEMHAALSDALHIDRSTPAAPTTLAYTSYLLATEYGGSFAEGLGAVLPCYWMYVSMTARSSFAWTDAPG